MNNVAIMAILSFLIGLPIIFFSFISITIRGKRQIELRKLEKEILQLELEKEKTRLKLKEFENNKSNKKIFEK